MDSREIKGWLFVAIRAEHLMAADKISEFFRTEGARERQGPDGKWQKRNPTMHCNSAVVTSVDCKTGFFFF